ncbi:MAG: bZIP transcription factor [bacterium]
MNSRPLAFFSIVFFMLLLFVGSVLSQTNTFPASGAAGIGTTTPEASVGLHTRFSGQKSHLRLENSGRSEYFDFRISSTGRFLIGVFDSTTTYYPIGIHPDQVGTDLLSLREGKIGIGLNNPATLLHMRSASGPAELNIFAGTADLAGIRLQNPNQRFDLRTGADSTFSIQDLSVSQTPFVIKRAPGNNLLYLAAGKVGIGTSSATAKVHINASNNPIPLRIANGTSDLTVDASAGMGLINLAAGAQINSAGTGYIFTSTRGASRVKLHEGFMAFYTSNTITGTTGSPIPSLDTARVVINSLGNVGIGTVSPASGYRLSVNGKIRAKEVVVETGWSDFVFDDDYALRPLAEVERFVKANKRLPEIPSAQEVTKKGVSVGEMQAKLLQKIEELTLYVIELKKENEQLQQRMAELEKR